MGGWVGVQTPPSPSRGGGTFFDASVLMGSWTVTSFLNRCCLVAGCLGRQVSLLPLRGGRRGCLGTQGVQESRVGCKNKDLYVPLLPSRSGVTPCCCVLLWWHAGWVGGWVAVQQPPPPPPWGLDNSGSLDFPKIWVGGSCYSAPLPPPPVEAHPWERLLLFCCLCSAICCVILQAVSSGWGTSPPPFVGGCVHNTLADSSVIGFCSCALVLRANNSVPKHHRALFPFWDDSHLLPLFELGRGVMRHHAVQCSAVNIVDCFLVDGNFQPPRPVHTCSEGCGLLAVSR